MDSNTDKNCGNCANMENCAKHAWMRCTGDLETWVPIIFPDKTKDETESQIQNS